MTTKGTLRGDSRLNQREDPTHLYAIGQAVRLRGGFGHSATSSDIYHITSLLPSHGGSLQYRIRNDEERHERVATQDSLKSVSMPLSGGEGTLIERTFGHGQGTETQQSRIQKT